MPVQVLFPDMFNEHVWEKYFMVVRSHQAGYISQTCSSEHAWEKFWHQGGPRRGVHFPDMFIKNADFFSHFFFSNGLGVGADVSRRLRSQDHRNFLKSWKIGKFPISQKIFLNRKYSK